ncbi:LmeA family phospholipid-binding protein [Mycolicibacterium phlei]
MTDPWARPNQPVPPPQGELPPQSPPPQDPPTVQAPQTPPPPAQATPPQMPPQMPPPPQDPPAGAKGSKVKDLLRDPLSIVLIFVIVIALALAGLVGGELYARNRADTVVAGAVACVVQDEASASFGVMPPFLVQHMTGHYTNIHVETAGNQIRDAKGMKVNLQIDDVRLTDTATSSGTIGSLVANVEWSTDGIYQTITDSVPIIGAFVRGVSTNPSAGTVELEGVLGSITAKPTVVNGAISLQVLELTGLGFTLPRETVQPMLDAFTAKLTSDYPMGIKADSVEVTDSGVTSRFSTRNADIPKGQQDPCFANL